MPEIVLLPWSSPRIQAVLFMLLPQLLPVSEVIKSNESTLEAVVPVPIVPAVVCVDHACVGRADEVHVPLTDIGMSGASDSGAELSYNYTVEYTRAHTCMRARTHTDRHTHIHTDTHTRTHTHKRKQDLFGSSTIIELTKQ